MAPPLVQDRTARRVFAKAAPAKAGTVTLTVIGVRYRTRSGHLVVAPDCPPFAVAAAGPGDIAPTEAQRARVLELWSTDASTGDWFTFPSDVAPQAHHGQRPTTPSPAPPADDKDTDPDE